MGRGLRQSVASAMVLMLVAYAPAVTPAGDASSSPAGTLAWPAPPAEPVVRHVRAIAGPEGWGITPSLFGRIVDALSGKQDERFVRPTGVAEHEGVLYVADPGAPALWIVDAPQNRVTRVDRVADAPLVSPVAVALGPEGSVFVADSVLKKVFRLDRAGKLLEVAAAELARPAGLAYDDDRRELYVADSAAHRVAVFGAGGALVRAFGERGAGDGEFNGPTHIAFERGGALLVTDALNYRVEAFDRAGRFLWKMGRQGDGSGDFAAPKGVASDGAGHVYVVDALFDTVQVFDTAGALLFSFGERGTRDGQFWLPGGLFIGPQGEIYVADAYNRRIQEFRGMTSGGKGAPK
jgi:DNA-binding beta-propeller fold protein YncE